MSTCPFCGFPEADSAGYGAYRWACDTYKVDDQHEPHQSRECEAYCQGKEDGRRLGHLEAVWQLALDLNAVADQHPVSLVDDELVEIPRDSWMWLMKAATRLRRRLARMRRQG